MALRPITLSIPSTTNIKIAFSEKLSKAISVDNFEIESLNGAVENLQVLSVIITNNIVELKTRPQVSGSYYLLKFVDTVEVIFATEKGIRLIDDSVSREIFFVGIDNINPVRDRMFQGVPDLFNLDGSILKNILSSQANEILKLQKDIGSVLSDNYISESVVDEIRTRGPGAFDRMAHENAYEIIRVGDKLTKESLKSETLQFLETNLTPRTQSLSVYPTSLQQATIEDEEINLTSEGNSFDGFLLNLKNKNVLKVLSVLLIRASDEEDCDNDIGTFYDIERFKYTIQNNYYDQDYAFLLSSLESNQVLLSEFGNIERPSVFDSVYVSYLYKDLGKLIHIDEISVYRVESAENEAVPSNAVSFFLKNAPIINSSNEILTYNGLTFKTNENDTSLPQEFLTEISFNAARLPSSVGEWACNYETGEVFVYGADDSISGTGRNHYVLDYTYRKEFKKDLDYSISEQNLVPTPDRNLSNNEAEIFILYDKVFAPDVDYRKSSHIEVSSEFVENRLGQSFSLFPQKTPVTDVFRILNQTTGEVYNPIYFNDTEIFFAGNRSPEIKTVKEEKANFLKVTNEQLNVVGEFVAPTFTVEITSTASNNSIELSPGIPAELIAENSNEYFIREVSQTSDEEYLAEDIQIKFFGDSDTGNLISSIGINLSATAPSTGTKVVIGPKAYIVNLENIRILNKNEDALGSLANSSVFFSEKTLFENEKYYEEIRINPGFESATNGGISKILTAEKDDIFYKNLEKLRVIGDYLIDYKFGICYVAVSINQDVDIGKIHYSYAAHKTRGKNILTVSSAANKVNAPDNLIDANRVYNLYDSDVEAISILDIENGLTIYDGETKAADQDNNLINICEVQEDYTVVVPYNILGINHIFKKSDLEDNNLNASAEKDRSPGLSAALLKANIKQGGRNLYTASCVSFIDNIIDLKKTIERRAYKDSLGNFIISISDSNAQTFVKAIKKSTDLVLFDEKLNITKLNVVVVANEVSGANIKVSIDSSTSIADVTTSNFILDSDGNRFAIKDVDSFLSIITVASPAENSTAAEPTLGTAEIIVKPTITVTSSGLTISIPEDANIANGEIIEIIYLTDQIPGIGTPLVVDYRYGFQYFDYTHLYDELVLWYEYGDNSIDWGISSALSEGDTYFVTYKYGALRKALRANFGSLTDIDFFKTFPLEINRELYRDAIKGTLQTFPKGPTIPAFKELVKSFTDIEPELNELAFGNWILGRDYMRPQNIDYAGILKFKKGRFDDGLFYADDITTKMPAISSLPLSEGTLECWVRPEWSGIANDATLTFDLNNIGNESLFLAPSENLFNKDFEIYPENDSIGGSDSSGFGTEIFNYRTNSNLLSGIEQGQFGIFKKFLNLLPITRSEQNITAFVDNFGFVFNTLSDKGYLDLNDSFKVFSVLSFDNCKKIGLDFELEVLKKFKVNIGLATLDSEEIEDFDAPYPVFNCQCSFKNIQESLAGINDLLIEVTPTSSFNLKTSLVSYETISNSAESFVFVDSNGYIYEVVNFELLSGELTTKISNSIKKINIKKIPLNNQYLITQDSDSINDNLPIGSLNLYVKILKPTFNNKNSFKAFRSSAKYIVNWSNEVKTRIIREPALNLVTLSINRQRFKTFYSDYDNVNFIESKLNGFVFGALDSKILTEATLLRGKVSVNNYFNKKDIYIGSAGFNPKRIPFSLNTEDSPNSPIGIPKNIEKDEGIFIWYDEQCENPLSGEIGQWILRTRGNRREENPVGVIVNGFEDYINIYDDLIINKSFIGNIITDGEFASVMRSHRDETLGGCTSGEICSSVFRYCGNGLLETEGWHRMSETNSDLINAIVSGGPTDLVPWVKYGNFNTSSSKGIFRSGPSADDNICSETEFNGNTLYSKLPCGGGNIEYTISAKVVSYADTSDSDIGEFSGAVNGNLTGVTLAHINDGTINIKLSLGIGIAGESLILILDGENNFILDVIPFIWDDNKFHEYIIDKRSSEGYLDIIIDSKTLSRIELFEFSEPVNFELSSIFSQEFVAFHLVDSEAVSSEELHVVGNNIIDIDFILFSGNYSEGTPKLESSDVLIHTDSNIDFEFYIDSLDIADGYDGYDGYSDALFGVDEMLISSDRRRYLVDAGVDDGDRRFSIYKDGKGFLNFRIYDSSLFNYNDVGLYNLATNIKHFAAGELHHIGASWRFNSIEEKDEMHLFVDGQEAPNIYKFGGKIPVAINSKFSDISKESLQDFLVKDIDYCQLHIGTTLANSTIFSSEDAFAEEMIGRSVIITDSTLYPTLIGAELVITSVIDNSQVTFGSGADLQAVSFTTSASDIEFKFAPIAGLSSPVMTDLKNSRFQIFRTDALGDTKELGGILYKIENGNIVIVSGDHLIEPEFRANINSRVIEFVGRDEDCKYVATVESTDFNVHIETFGLNAENCKFKMNLPGSSYSSAGDYTDGLSIIKTRKAEPISLADVSIKRIVLDRTVIDIGLPIRLGLNKFLVDFSIDLSASNNYLSSQWCRVKRSSNRGRYLELFFDSDNVHYCDFSSDEDGYQDGYLDGGLNTITVYGTTTDGIDEETIFIRKNGSYVLTKLFTSIDRVDGSLEIIDEDYFEAGVIEIRELNSITVSDNNGECAEVWEYRNGAFTITAKGSNGVMPFELNPGFYEIEYPSFLRININQTGHDLYIGSDFRGEQQFGGVIDEFRIITEMSSDTRVTENDTLGTRSITEDYNKTIPFCPNSQTTSLVHFNNPIELQYRRLRRAEFLNEEDNYKFNLNTKQLSTLLRYINNENSFVLSMVNMGFEKDDAIRVYYEAHKAENGPLFNDANYHNTFIDLLLSSNSVNSGFGYSGIFTKNKPLLLSNDSGIFRPKEGTVEFWVSPILDTTIDAEKRYFVDISSISRERVRSRNTSTIFLKSKAKEILSVKLITNARRFERFYNDFEKNKILFDEISRSDISGVLEGGTGSQKDFSVGARLSSDGRKIFLAESLPGELIDVIVTYIPIDSNGDRVSVFKDEYGNIVFSVTADGVDHVVTMPVNWKKNSWHRVMCSYRANSLDDFMKIFVDGEEGGYIRYGEGILYGTGYIYGQFMKKAGQAKNIDFKIKLGEDLKLISLGSDIFGDNSARARMDNIRFSRIPREVARDSSGNLIDLNYSSNINTVYPVGIDDATTYIQDFDENGDKLNKFATIIDPENGIFEFDVFVLDNFDKVININNGQIEDLIIDLVNRLKPAHANANIKFIKNKC